MEIRALADSFNAKFVITSKVEVNGSNAHPLFDFAKAALPGLCGTTNIKWNFTKFLFDATGAPVKRFSPTDSPLSFENDIREAARASPSVDRSPKNKMP